MMRRAEIALVHVRSEPFSIGVLARARETAVRDRERGIFEHIVNEKRAPA